VQTRPIRILLIEPGPYVAHAYERALKRAGEVTIAGAASYALEWLSARQRFDAILCAVMMRHLTGPEFYRRARHIDDSGGTQLDQERAVCPLPNLVLVTPVPLERLLGVVALVAEELSVRRPPT
jgi:CheY-like chemotaxis protein